MDVMSLDIGNLSSTELTSMIFASYTLDKKEPLAFDQLAMWLKEKYSAQYDSNGVFYFSNAEKYTEFYLTWM